MSTTQAWHLATGLRDTAAFGNAIFWLVFSGNTDSPFLARQARHTSIRDAECEGIQQVCADGQVSVRLKRTNSPSPPPVKYDRFQAHVSLMSHTDLPRARAAPPPPDVTSAVPATPKPPHDTGRQAEAALTLSRLHTTPVASSTPTSAAAQRTPLRPVAPAPFLTPLRPTWPPIHTSTHFSARVRSPYHYPGPHLNFLHPSAYQQTPQAAPTHRQLRRATGGVRGRREGDEHNVNRDSNKRGRKTSTSDR